MLNKLSFQKKPFFKSDGGHAISRQEKRRLPKMTTRFPSEKKRYSPPHEGLSWDSPPPPPESVQAGGRTLTSQPNFLASIGYQICLAVVLRMRATRVGSAMKFVVLSGPD